MAVTLNDSARKILDGKNFATLATLNEDGSPQTSVVWVKRDGDDVLASTVVGRRKEKNLRRDPRVSLSAFDLEQPYEYVEVRGEATLTEEGGRALIDDLANKYTGEDYKWDGPETRRVIIRISPKHVTGMSG